MRMSNLLYVVMFVFWIHISFCVAGVWILEVTVWVDEGPGFTYTVEHQTVWISALAYTLCMYVFFRGLASRQAGKWSKRKVDGKLERDLFKNMLKFQHIFSIWRYRQNRLKFYEAVEIGMLLMSSKNPVKKLKSRLVINLENFDALEGPFGKFGRTEFNWKDG